MYSHQSEFHETGPPTDVPFAHGTFVRNTPPPEVSRVSSPGYVPPPAGTFWVPTDEEVAEWERQEACFRRQASPLFQWDAAPCRESSEVLHEVADFGDVGGGPWLSQGDGELLDVFFFLLFGCGQALSQWVGSPLSGVPGTG